MSLKQIMRAPRLFACAAALLLAVGAAPAARAQEEGAPVVVDEVIAQVNNDVVTLSMLKRDMKMATRALVDQRGMTQEQAAAEVEKNRAKMIANLINEQLINQKGKELPRVSEDVEAEVNRTMLAEGKRQGITTMERLEDEMRKAGLDPVEIRSTLRAQFTRQAVLQREVDAKIYFSLTDAELQKYFAANREKFRKPESVELSEIFLSLAGRPEAEVRAKAAQLVARARGGADFAQLAATHSEREGAAQSKGKVGRFEVPDLNEAIAGAIKNLKTGQVTDPIKTVEGIQILRVDDRAGSSEPVFNEQAVRGAITQERAEREREEYLKKLREEAYISVSESYKPIIEPLLILKPRATASKDADGDKKKN